MEEELSVSNGESTRVAFILPLVDWLGGRNYLRNLFAALGTLSANPITPVIFAGKRQCDALADFPAIEVIQTSILDRKSPGWIMRKIIEKTTARDAILQRLLKKHDISVLSHSPHLGRQTAVKTIGWIPDFQHLHLPELFTPEERLHRDRQYTEFCMLCDKIIVSSEFARADLLRFSPAHAHKIEVLQFVASPLSTARAASLQDLQRIYDFSQPYFLLPNQFWAHKNHRVVLSALQILKRRNDRLLVLATGSTEDYRNPSFFPSLMEYAAECNVLDCFRVLGKIPFDHLVGLMQHAVAFINPSRFEGWSTSVEEAKSMGKQIVLSDIPGHREQAPERGFFFPMDDPQTLAAAMIAAYNGWYQEDVAAQDAAISRCLNRQRQYAEGYFQIVQRALRHNIS